ncbi:MAG: glycerol dehydrogenase [Actinomycetes bacterium]
MLSVFCSPSRYVQGRDATGALGDQMRKVGLDGPAYILATQRTAGLLGQTWSDSLTSAGIDYLVGDFGGECTEDEISAGTQRARDAKANVVVGAGGGKALDTARAIAANLEIPVVNCPTLASSDAPCSALSVVYDANGTFAKLLFYPRNPDLVLVDTTLVAQAPRRFLVSGMGDALATWFEARTVIEACKPNQVHGGTTLTGGALARLCYDTLRADGPAAAAAVDSCAVTPALERVVEANTLLSGLGFESGGLAIAHSVHNGLTTAPATHDYLHGEKVAFGLLVQLVVEGRPTSEFTDVCRFSLEVGLPTTLTDIGLSADDEPALRVIAERTIAEGETAHNEPFEVTAEAIFDGIRTANCLAAAEIAK